MIGRASVCQAPFFREVGNEVLLGEFPGGAHGFSVCVLMGSTDGSGRTLLRTAAG